MRLLLPLAAALLATGCDPITCESLDADQSADDLRTCVSTATLGDEPDTVTLADGTTLEPALVIYGEDMSYLRKWEPPPTDTFGDGERVSFDDGHLRWSRGGQLLRRDSVGAPAGTVSAAPTGDRYAYPLADGAVRLRSRDGSDPVDLPVEIEWMEIGSFRGALSVRTAFSADGRRLAVADGSGTAIVVDARTGDRLWEVAIDTTARPVALSPDGGHVSAVLRDGLVGVWDVASGAEIGRWAHPDRVNGATFGPDGSLIVWLSERSSTTTHRMNERTTVGANQSYESTYTTPPSIVVWRVP